MNLSIDLSQVEKKNIRPLDDHFRGKSRSGREISFTNYYMEADGKPFFAVSGEIHFSRVARERWEDELLKMKAGGINVIATYVFWNHHEEIEGNFRFDGCRDIGSFVRLCHKHDLFVILRVGPFAHGEVRNGGLPDWLYGKDFQVRSINEGWLYYSARYYRRIARQVRGLFFSDDGPIIGVQIDNEYMHSAAPWEMTVGTTNEWVFAGNEGDTYMLTMRGLAAKEGLQPVFYTATAWGGAIAPESMLPLWGGYAFRPWLFYNRVGEHPLTEEFIYQDFHNNEFKSRTDFNPRYLPEDMPYACCEMGGGMMVSYYYRFQFPYKSVDAMANIKLASGCNYLGYYMYRGGTNPRGIHGGFLNEGQISKISYDYQAAIGEFGQIRESYLRLKNLHYLTSYFSDQFIDLPTVLPAGGAEIEPDDLDSFRYAFRTNGERGFLFINNYQDHARMTVKKDVNIDLRLKSSGLRFSDLSIETDENCVLPFNLDLGGICLVTATAQPIGYVDEDGLRTYFFAVPAGMRGKFEFDSAVKINGERSAMYHCAENLEAQAFMVTEGDKEIRICCLNRDLALNLYLADGRAYLTTAAFMQDKHGIRLETKDYETGFYRYRSAAEPCSVLTDIFEPERFSTREVRLEVEAEAVAPYRWKVCLPETVFAEMNRQAIKDVRIQIDYTGDVGQAFVNGRMLHDNFANGDTWEISVRDFYHELQEGDLIIYITPLKEGTTVKVDSPMAARSESSEKVVAELYNIQLLPIYEFEAELR